MSTRKRDTGGWNIIRIKVVKHSSIHCPANVVGSRMTTIKFCRLSYSHILWLWFFYECYCYCIATIPCNKQIWARNAIPVPYLRYARGETHYRNLDIIIIIVLFTDAWCIYSTLCNSTFYNQICWRSRLWIRPIEIQSDTLHHCSIVFRKSENCQNSLVLANPR